MSYAHSKIVFGISLIVFFSLAIQAEAGLGNLGWADAKSGESHKSKSDLTFSRAFVFVRPYAAFMKYEYKQTMSYSGGQQAYSNSNSEFMPQIAAGFGYRVYGHSPIGLDVAIVALANGGIQTSSDVAILTYFDAGPEIGYSILLGKQVVRPFLSFSLGLSVPIHGEPVPTDLAHAVRLGVEGRVSRNLALVLGIEQVKFAALGHYDYYGYDSGWNVEIKPSLSGVFLSARFYML